MTKRDTFTYREIREAGTLVHGRLPGEVVLPGKVKDPRADPERQLQRQVCKALDLAGVVYFHCGNERAGRIERMMLAAEGVKAGVPDLGFPFALSGLPRMGWVELKSKAGSLTTEQRWWRDYLKSCGHEWACLKSVESVVETLTFWRVPGASRIRL